MSRSVVYKVLLASPGFVCVAGTLNTRCVLWTDCRGHDTKSSTTTPRRCPAAVGNLFPCGSSPAVPPQAHGRPREAQPRAPAPPSGRAGIGPRAPTHSHLPLRAEGVQATPHAWLGCGGGQRGQLLSCRDASGASPCPHRNTLQHSPCFCCLTPSSGQAFASHQALEVWRTDTSRTLFLATDTPERPRGSALWGTTVEAHGQAPGSDPRGSESGGVRGHPAGSWALEGLCADPLHFQMRTRGLREVTRLPEATEPTGGRTQS